MAAYAGSGVVDFERSVCRENEATASGFWLHQAAVLASGEVPKLRWSEGH